jgi:hypothetical protein
MFIAFCTTCPPNNASRMTNVTKNKRKEERMLMNNIENPYKSKDMPTMPKVEKTS